MRSRRSPLRILLAVCLAVAVLAPAQAFADGYNDAGGSGSGGGGDSGGTGNSYCVNGEGWFNGRPIYDAWWPRCAPGGGGFQKDGYTALCQTGFDVWRFWGHKNSPVEGWSASRINLDYWCENNPLISLFSPHPHDAGAMLNAPPWVNDVHTNGATPPQTVVRAPNSRYTTLPPFRSGGASCSALITRPDPWAPVVNADSELGAKVRTDIAYMYNAWSYMFSPPIARQLVNARFVNGTNPGDIGWDDGVPCSSGMELFNAADPSNPAVFGTCWIPTERRMVRWRNAAGELAPSWPVRGRHRYDDTYGPQTVPADKPWHAEWRRVIIAEVGSRPGTMGLEVPGQPYPADYDNPPEPDRRLAAEAAARFARCEDGAYSAYGMEETVTGTSGLETITVTSPQPEVGGELRPARWTAQVTDSVFPSAELSGPGAPAATVTRRSWDFKLVGVGGYTECTSSAAERTPGACQFAQQVSPQKRNLMSSQNLDGWFYAATQPASAGKAAQKVRVELSNVTAEYRRWWWDTCYLTVPGDPPTTQPYDCLRSETVPFTPTVVYAPDGAQERTVVGATPKRR